MLEHIVAQTNLSAQQFIESNDLAPHSRVRRWSKGVHDLSELKHFLSLIIVMGLVRYPTKSVACACVYRKLIMCVCVMYRST